MRNKQIFSYLIPFFFLICLVFLSGCGGGNEAKKEKQENDKPEEQGIRNENVEQLKAINQEQEELVKLALREVGARDTSVNKINQDLAEEKITEKEAVKLRLTALVGSEDLDDDYKGEEIKGRSSLNSDTIWILNNWNSFSEEERRGFKPYVLPPDEEGSIFYGEDGDLGGLFIKKARAASPDWENREVNLGAFAKLFYKQKNSWSESRKDKEEDRSIYLEIALEDSWPKFKDLLGIDPGEKVYVYLVEMNDCGEAYMYNKDGAERCIINIKADQSEKLLKSSLAHELFHCFQFELANKYRHSGDDLDWIREGTAVWAEDHVYPDYNSEHQYLPDYFFGHLDEELVTSKEDWEYGRYLWFYFLSQYYNNDHVVQTLKKGGEGSIREAAMNSVPEYKLAYQEFAFYNWNYGPFFKYSDTPQFPQDAHPAGGAFKYHTNFDEQERKDYPVELNKGSMQYINHSFNPMQGGAKFAVFDIEEHSDNITITALINGSGGWRKENWNNVGEKQICLEDEEISMIVLIMANSDLGSEAKINYGLELEKECPRISRGTMILEERMNSGPNYRKVFMKSEDILEYDRERDCYYIVERSINCDYESFSEVMAGTPMHLESTEKGQGGTRETYYDMEDKPGRLCFNSDHTTFILDPDTKSNYYMDITYTMTANEPRTEKNTCPGLWPTNHVIDSENISENRIKGEESFSSPGVFGEAEIKIKYDYVFYR
jgi:hypothetical protein